MGRREIVEYLGQTGSSIDLVAGNSQPWDRLIGGVLRLIGVVPVQLACANEVVVPTADDVDSWQIRRRRQVNIEVVEEFAGSTPRVSERSNVLLAQSRFRHEVRGSIGEPREFVPFGDDAAGEFHGGLAA